LGKKSLKFCRDWCFIILFLNLFYYLLFTEWPNKFLILIKIT
jgi:hypothetical protein